MFMGCLRQPILSKDNLNHKDEAKMENFVIYAIRSSLEEAWSTNVMKVFKKVSGKGDDRVELKHLKNLNFKKMCR